MIFNLQLSPEQVNTVLTSLNVLQGNASATAELIVKQAQEQAPKAPEAPEASPAA